MSGWTSCARARTSGTEKRIPLVYDLELDTSLTSADECAARIADLIATRMPTAFGRLSAM